VLCRNTPPNWSSQTGIISSWFVDCIYSAWFCCFTLVCMSVLMWQMYLPGRSLRLQECEALEENLRLRLQLIIIDEANIVTRDSYSRIVMPICRIATLSAVPLIRSYISYGADMDGKWPILILVICKSTALKLDLEMKSRIIATPWKFFGERLPSSRLGCQFQRIERYKWIESTASGLYFYLPSFPRDYKLRANLNPFNALNHYILIFNHIRACFVL
jgi:hypothetical protein